MINFKDGMRDENREAGPGYAPFGRRDKGWTGLGGIRDWTGIGGIII